MRRIIVALSFCLTVLAAPAENRAARRPRASRPVCRNRGEDRRRGARAFARE